MRAHRAPEGERPNNSDRWKGLTAALVTVCLVGLGLVLWQLKSQDGTIQSQTTQIKAQNTQIISLGQRLVSIQKFDHDQVTQQLAAAANGPAEINAIEHKVVAAVNAGTAALLKNGPGNRAILCVLILDAPPSPARTDAIAKANCSP